MNQKSLTCCWGGFLGLGVICYFILTVIAAFEMPAYMPILAFVWIIASIAVSAAVGGGGGFALCEGITFFYCLLWWQFVGETSLIDPYKPEFQNLAMYIAPFIGAVLLWYIGYLIHDKIDEKREKKAAEKAARTQPASVTEPAPVTESVKPEEPESKPEPVPEEVKPEKPTPKPKPIAEPKAEPAEESDSAKELRQAEEERRQAEEERRRAEEARRLADDARRRAERAAKEMEDSLKRVQRAEEDLKKAQEQLEQLKKAQAEAKKCKN